MQLPLLLPGKRVLVVGIADQDSIATGIARALHEAGARLAITWKNSKIRPETEAIGRELDAEILLPLEVREATEMDTLFGTIAARWGGLDGVVHSIAWAPRQALAAPIMDVTLADFTAAMDISCHSFMRLAQRAAPLMEHGGALITLTYQGAERVVPNYGIMGPVKAALEASCRSLAAELGPRGIRVHAVSPGPIATRAAGALPDFAKLLADSAAEAPARRLATQADVGATCAFLLSEHAAAVSGGVVFVDGGQHVMA
jgi:enoyl-[acyl-carrier protein] reductase I